MEWESVIGLEIHCQLATESKLFSGASTEYGAAPNTRACAVDLGLPGVLPTLNKQAIEMAIRFGLAINAEIANTSIFARKNYFYPDLPKGYQISQYEQPIVGKGHISIELEDGASKTIGITRAHLEEDAGKSVHDAFADCTGIDLNRSGTALIEIVSEPDMANAREAVACMKKIHSLVRYLQISDGIMQEGSFRCDANVSVRPHGEKKLGTRTELKNINSFRFVEQAIDYEIKRQIAALEDDEEIIQETRLYDPDKNETRSMRTKEEAYDYRYFPDPDLLPIKIEPELIEKIRSELPELPNDKKRRFIDEFGLSEYNSAILTAQKEMADYFESCVKAADGEVALSANWITGELLASLNRENKDITGSPVSAKMLGGLIRHINNNTLSGRMAKQVFEAMWNREGSVDQIIAKKGLKQMSDPEELEKLVDEVIAGNPNQVEQYRSSSADKQKKLISFFIGQIMKATRGMAHPQEVNRLLNEKLTK